MISIRSIVASAATRFLPGVWIFWTVGLRMTARFTGLTLGPVRLQALSNRSLSLALGYVIALLIMRPWLAEDASVGGRRGFVAGLGAAAVHLGFAGLVGGPVNRSLNLVLAGVAGLVLTAMLFAPWLGRSETPTHLVIGDADVLPALDRGRSMKEHSVREPHPTHLERKLT